MKRPVSFFFAALCLSFSGILMASLLDRAPQASPTSGTGLEQSGIVAVYGGQGVNTLYLLDENGQVWYASRWNTSNIECWRAEPEFAIPVPVSEIKHWSLYFLVTNDDHLWVLANGWTDCGRWPNAPVSSRPATLGGLKGRYSAGDSAR